MVQAYNHFMSAQAHTPIVQNIPGSRYSHHNPTSESKNPASASRTPTTNKQTHLIPIHLAPPRQVHALPRMCSPRDTVCRNIQHVPAAVREPLVRAAGVARPHLEPRAVRRAAIRDVEAEVAHADLGPLESPPLAWVAVAVVAVLWRS